MDSKQFKIFIDFDGTITIIDVGAAIFEKFGEPSAVKKVIELYLNDEVTAKDCWMLLCDSVKELNLDKFDDYIETFDDDKTLEDPFIIQ